MPGQTHHRTVWLKPRAPPLPHTPGTPADTQRAGCAKRLRERVGSRRTDPGPSPQSVVRGLVGHAVYRVGEVAQVVQVVRYHRLEQVRVQFLVLVNGQVAKPHHALEPPVQVSVDEPRPAHEAKRVAAGLG